MKRRLIPLINALSIVAILAGIVGWIASHRCQMIAVWTSGTEHNQVMSRNGAVFLVQNHLWWRREKFGIQIDPQPGNEPIANWPGLQLGICHEWFGFTLAKGDWVSPFIEVPAGTVFTPHQAAVAPGTMFRTTTKVDIYGVPYWAFVSMPTGWIAAYLIYRSRTGRPVAAVHQLGNRGS